jgi:ABC-type multidrug transport system fused ATPase/permease subunit
MNSDHDGLTRGKTTIMIAHRLSTVEIAARIFVLDGGQIVHEGIHSELVARPAPIARFTTRNPQKKYGMSGAA